MRRRIAVTCSALLIASGMCQSPAAAAEPPDGVAPAAPAAAGDPDAINRQNATLLDVASGHRAGSGGTYLDRATGELVVRYVDNADGRTLRAKLESRPRRAGDERIRFEKTGTPIAELRETAQRLAKDRSWAGADAGAVHGVWLNESKLRLVVSATGRSEALIAAVTAATGLVPEIALSKTGPVQQDTRRADTGLVQGGAALWLGSGGSGNTSADCTSGFRMTRGGTNSNWMTTAGHCSTDANGNPVNGVWFWNSGTAVGRSSSNYFNLGTDVAMLAPADTRAFSRYIWFGERNATVKRAVTAKNTALPAVDSAVFVSGANGGLVHGVVEATNSPHPDCPGATVLINTRSAGHPQSGATLRGDSGAPVFKYNTTTSDTTDVTAVGSHSCGDGVSRSWFVPIQDVERATGSVVVIGGN